MKEKNPFMDTFELEKNPLRDNYFEIFGKTVNELWGMGTFRYIQIDSKAD